MKCTVFGLHSSSVSELAPGPESSAILLRSRTMLCTAIAMPELGMSTTASTLPLSNQPRTICTPTSVFIWWSALMISIGLPSTVGPNSSTAILAASTEPGPLLSRPQLDRSVSTPIRTASSETCARAAVVMAAEVMAASKVQAKSPLIVDPSLLWAAWRGRLFWR